MRGEDDDEEEARRFRGRLGPARAPAAGLRAIDASDDQTTSDYQSKPRDQSKPLEECV